MRSRFTKLPPDFDWTLFVQYLLGIFSDDKINSVAGWVKQSALLQLIETTVRGSVSQEIAEGRSRVISAVHERLGTVPANLAHPKEAENGVGKIDFSGETFRNDALKGGVYSGIKVRRWVRYSAIAVFCTLIAIIAWRTSDSTSSSPNTHKTYVTIAAQRATVTLPSGVQATLGPATKLVVYENKVMLNGQAAFTILHRTHKPFTVQAGNTIARVLGTSFVVRSYAEDKSVRVAVAEGKVSVNSAVLTAGDIATSYPGSKIDVEHDAEAMLNAFAFSQGKLIITVQTLAEAAPELSRWLDLDIRIDSAAAKQRLTTALQGHSSTQALNEIAVLTETRYHRNGRIVTFTRDR